MYQGSLLAACSPPRVAAKPVSYRAGFALACGEYLSDAATSAIIVTPVPIHTVAGKRRLECAGLLSASRSVFEFFSRNHVFLLPDKCSRYLHH